LENARKKKAKRGKGKRGETGVEKLKAMGLNIPVWWGVN